jgi:hypothetical protein
MDVFANAMPEGSQPLGMIGDALFYLYEKSIISVNIEEFLSNPETPHKEVTQLDTEFVDSKIISVCMLPENLQIQILNSSGSLAVVNATDGHVMYITTGSGTVSVTEGTRTEYRL